MCLLWHIYILRLFEDKVYLAVLAKGVTMRKNRYAQEEGNVKSGIVDIEAKISDEVGLYITQRAIF